MYSFLKKEVKFDWSLKQFEAMKILKLKLISPSAFIFIDYSKNADSIIFAIDANLDGWGAALMQIRERK